MSNVSCEKKMAKIQIDFRFVELGYELWGLERYREVLEEQVKFLRDQKEIQAKAWLKQEGICPGNAGYHIAMQEVSELVDGVVPRFYRGPFLVALWSIFESGMEEISRYVSEKRGAGLRLRDIYGRTPEDKWRKYFEYVLDYDLRIDESSWKRLEELRALRNALAHSNGRVGLLKDDLSNKIKRWAEENRGIYIHLDFVTVSQKYAKEANDLVQNLLTDLISRVKRNFP